MSPDGCPRLHRSQSPFFSGASPLLTETHRHDRSGRNSSMKSTPASPCQRGGRRFAAELRSASAKRAKPASEPGFVLQHSRAPSRCYAEGLFVGSKCVGLGGAGVPSGVAEIEEAEVGLLFPQRLREDAQR
jgi:hypothetical protein